jgi:hypothetical protein
MSSSSSSSSPPSPPASCGSVKKLKKDSTFSTLVTTLPAAPRTPTPEHTHTQARAVQPGQGRPGMADRAGSNGTRGTAKGGPPRGKPMHATDNLPFFPFFLTVFSVKFLPAFHSILVLQQA